MRKKNEKRLVIACGGTGGHLFPGIAVAEAWKSRGGESLLVISEKQIDALASEGYDDLRFERMKSIAMPRIYSPKMIGFLFGFAGGLAQCRKIIRGFEADAVLGMGGFTSTAPLIAGRWRRLPTFIHESNAIPGRANQLNARFASTVLAGFEECARHFGERDVAVVGTPIRPAVAEKPSRADALAHFGMREDRLTVMVMGGSQGARRINQLVCEALPRLPGDRVQVLHITGPADFDEARIAHESLPAGHSSVVLPFCGEMQLALAAADLAICRSGASTLTELSYYGIPSILIPYPFAADDHQTRNAEIFSIPGAAELWDQKDLDPDTFTQRLIEWIGDPEKRDRMKARMEALAVPDASQRVCEVIEKAIVQGESRERHTN